ncbi:hypothetical protein HOB10_00370 [Candidatus Parcubacteria bacterium]|nr:hypothetical protein [Candidatus Parcubacteria bacterium]
MIFVSMDCIDQESASQEAADDGRLGTRCDIQPDVIEAIEDYGVDENPKDKGNSTKD